MKPPVVVIPGITATVLRDLYPPKPDSVWTMTNKEWERVAMHPDDRGREERQPSRVLPDEGFSIPYDELVKELRHDLSSHADEPRPVYLWGYDWRRPLEHTVEAFRAFCDDVAARTALLRHYARDGYTAEDGRVDVVAHSMGGLILTGYLAMNPSRHRVRKVVTLATPFRGSFEAVIKIATGTSGLDGGGPSSRERETARMTPALYYLLPDDPEDRDVLIREPADSLPDTLFDPGLWQHGVIETLAEHIRLRSVDPPRRKADRLARARELLGEMLGAAAKYRKRVRTFTLDRAGLAEDDWLAVVGVGSETRVRLRIEDGGASGPWFDLTSVHRRNGYPMPDLAPGGGIASGLEDTGDGTVPYWAAVPTFIPRRRLVAISKDDIGYWEILNRLLEGPATNLHGILPRMTRVIKLCAAFLDSDTGKRASAHPGIRGRRAPDAVSEPWDPPFAGLKEEIPDGWPENFAELIPEDPGE